MKKLVLTMLTVCLYATLVAQEEVMIQSQQVRLYGTLLVPAKKTAKAILIISGSGATDRDGNTKPAYVNNALKMLAGELNALGFTTLAYDKRGVGRSSSDSLKTEDLRFEQYVNDAVEWITFLKKNYTDITVIGHSQGALVGMMAVQKIQVKRFISLAGLSEDAYTTVRRQLANQPPVVTDAAYPILDSLKNGQKVREVPQLLNSLFAPKVQDYFISFMKYDPRAEIKKVSCPVLVVQGTTDLQITVEGAAAMCRNARNCSLKIIEDMNHVLRKSSKETTENISTYNNTLLPLHPGLIGTLKFFLESD